MLENQNSEAQVDPALSQELEQLNNKIEPKTNEQEATEPSVKLIEKDGELYINSESDDVVNDADPEKGESSQELTQSDEYTTDGNKPSPFHDKSKDDLVDMVVNAQKMIGDQSSEIGQLRKLTAEDEDLSEVELLERLTANDVQDALSTEKAKLDEVDPYDADAVSTQRSLIREMENDLINKRTQEHLESRLNGRDNEAFVSTMKQRFNTDGIEVSDDEFTAVSELAKGYTENGLLTERAYHKAMIDEFGVEKVAKNYQMAGERKARLDIQNASAKQVEKVDVRGTGKNAKLIRVADMNKKELRSTLDNLSVNELQKLYGQLNS
jgi:hypothetical protein|tara:strand:- start:978 stop:1949 length:972 start_codon:yes stop_codon:yes gene_type:complete